MRSRTRSAAKPATTRTSPMPTERRLESTRSRIVRSGLRGSSVFGSAAVSGCRRRPGPAASTTPVNESGNAPSDGPDRKAERKLEAIERSEQRHQVVVEAERALRDLPATEHAARHDPPEGAQWVHVPDRLHGEAGLLEQPSQRLALIAALVLHGAVDCAEEERMRGHEEEEMPTRREPRVELPQGALVIRNVLEHVEADDRVERPRLALELVCVRLDDLDVG